MRADDAKSPDSQRIARLDPIIIIGKSKLFLRALPAAKRRQRRARRDPQVLLLLHPKRPPSLTEQNISHRTPAHRGDGADRGASERVHPARRREQAPRHRERARAKVIRQP